MVMVGLVGFNNCIQALRLSDDPLIHFCKVKPGFFNRLCEQVALIPPIGAAPNE